jgi:diguanylate cyclase (GGDEF)-like protein
MRGYEFAPVSRRTELASLAERLGALSLTRVAIVVTLLGAGAFPGQTGVHVRRVAEIIGVYLVLEVAAELGRLISRRPALGLVGAMVLADAAFIVTVLYRSGGPGAPMAFVVEVHIIAVSLLVSARAGLKLAVWYTLCLAVAHAVRLGSGGSVGGEATAVLALWCAALATAVFSGVNERELRRSKAHLRALAELSSDLTGNLDPRRIPVRLLETVLPAFGFRRGAVVVDAGRAVRVTVAGADGAVTETEVDAALADATVLAAAGRRQPVLVRALGPADPLLAAALPAAVNVIVLPIVVDDRVLGAVALERAGRPGARMLARTVAVLTQFASSAALALRTAMLHAEVTRLATTDPLTGLANRRVFDENLAREIARSHRTSAPVALVFVDVDHFKSVNDRYGHETGDEVLRHVGRALARTARAADVAARFGGEEFVLLLPGADAAAARHAAERIRGAIADAGGSPVPVTASAGVAVGAGACLEPDQLLRAADAALYRSKRSGRNRTTVAAAVGR